MTDAKKPPTLAGYEYIDLLGTGGFADVYLYEQQMPRRRVAVKVLRDQGLTDDLRAQFTSEANVMASLSSHPYIVTIYAADVAADGRPYLVMEYYSGPNLSVRCRQRPLGVSEALRIGVQISGAVETAHRSGVLHRDLKPANILTSAFGKPGLTDFGISAVKADGTADAGGLSIPWSPPELLDDGGVADERSDVYSLAATVHTMLVGRSPFEVVGGGNSALDLMSRIERQQVPGVGRGDAPASLDRVLAAAMAKSPDARPASAAAFARTLQAVEREMRLQPTELDVPDEPGTADGDTAPTPHDRGLDEDGTRLRPAITVTAQPEARTPGLPAFAPPPSAPAPVRAESLPVAADHTVRRDSASQARDEGTVLRPTSVDPSVAPAEPRAARHRSATEIERDGAGRRGLLVIGGVLVAALVGVGAVVALGGRGGDAPTGTAPSTSTVVDPNAEDLLPPTGITLTRSGNQVTVRWSPATDFQPGDWYDVMRVGDASVRMSPPDAVSYTLTGVPVDERACVKVSHHRQGAVTGSSAATCEPAP
ncbi:MAG: serine/threonine-protein kinase [Candidatus Nanopelagicales bacterium]|jgi:serine/threonine protein kinase